jgi:general secretion pathway protein D
MPLRFFPLKTTVVSLIALSVMLPMSGCDLTQNHLKIDRTTNAEVQDYRDGLAPREVEFADGQVAEDVPDLQAYVSDDSQELKAMPLVSISINQSIPLREALFELAKQANYDVQLDPRITGSIIFTARNKPFDTVIEQICEISGLRYKIDGDNNLRIELDTPYSKNYKVDYLAFVRKNKSQISTDVGISGSSESSSAETGSNFQVDTTSESDFWAELDTNLKQILASNSQGSYLKTQADPQITLTSANPEVAPPVPPMDGAALNDNSPQAGTESSYVSAPMAVPASTTTPAPAEPATVDQQAVPASPASAPTPPPVTASTPVTPATSPAPQPMGQGAPVPAVPGQSTLRVESLPTGGTSDPNAVTFTPAYSVNKQAGIVSIYANERLHKQVETYLADLRRSTTSQVLIEAKILEVRLTDEYITGINWETVGQSLGEFSFDMNLATPIMNPDNGGNLFSIGYAGNDMSALVEALSRFGAVRALASPRVTVVNNQSAVLSVAKNTVYFELDVSSTTTQGTPPTRDTTVDSQIKTVPEGVLINVLPSIDLDRNQISMQVRPTVTRIDSVKPDPGVAFVAATAGVDITSDIPELNVQEIDSVVRMKSGQAMVMGGLLEDRTSSEQNGVPVLSEVPMLGSLFRSQNDKVKKTELVIFLKATILKDAGDSVHTTDRELYRTFAKDRRPTKM